MIWVWGFFYLDILRTFRCNCQKTSSMLIWMTNKKLMLIRFFSCLLLWLTCFDVMEGKKSQLLFWVFLGYLFTIQSLSKIVILGCGKSDFRSDGWHLCMKPNRWRSPFHCHIESSVRAVARAVWQKELWHSKVWWLCPNSAAATCDAQE